jgi:hypothetical protein
VGLLLAAREAQLFAAHVGSVREGLLRAIRAIWEAQLYWLLIGKHSISPEREQQTRRALLYVAREDGVRLFVLTHIAFPV